MCFPMQEKCCKCGALCVALQHPTTYATPFQTGRLFFPPGCKTIPKVQSRRGKNTPYPVNGGKSVKTRSTTTCTALGTTVISAKPPALSHILTQETSEIGHCSATVETARSQRSVVGRLFNNYNADLRVPLKFLDTFGRPPMCLTPTRNDTALHTTPRAAMSFVTGLSSKVCKDV